MTLGAKGIREDEWDAAAICPNPTCHMLLVRTAHLTMEGCIEHFCGHCRRRSIQGGPDRERPARPQVLIVRSYDEYRTHRERADNAKHGNNVRRSAAT